MKAKNDSELRAHVALKEVIWQNHALSQENHGLLVDLKKAHDENAKLKAAAIEKAQRPGVVR